MGRPRIQIEAEDVQNLAAVGCSVEEIAILVTPDEQAIKNKFINHRTIERRFAPALKKGRGMMKGRLRSAIFERAMAGDTTLLIFLAKTVLGMREKEKADVSVNVNVNTAACAAAADARSPEQVKAECLDLYRAIQEEANRYSAN
jgi:hypothetical protein